MGTRRSGSVLWVALVAALSATSLPTSPTWLGTQLRIGGCDKRSAAPRMALYRGTLSSGDLFARTWMEARESV